MNKKIWNLYKLIYNNKKIYKYLILNIENILHSKFSNYSYELHYSQYLL